MNDSRWAASDIFRTQCWNCVYVKVKNWGDKKSRRRRHAYTNWDAKHVNHPQVCCCFNEWMSVSVATWMEKDDLRNSWDVWWRHTPERRCDRHIWQVSNWAPAQWNGACGCRDCLRIRTYLRTCILAFGRTTPRCLPVYLFLCVCVCFCVKTMMVIDSTIVISGVDGIRMKSGNEWESWLLLLWAKVTLEARRWHLFVCCCCCCYYVLNVNLSIYICAPR